MIPLATADEVRRADRRAIEELGVPGVVLMENAGRGAADLIERVFGPARGRRVAVVAGKGNNGGDGFVVARHLAGRGATVDVWLVAAAADVRGDALVNLEALRRVGVGVTEVGARGGIDALGRSLRGADVVVDALLGTGASGAPSGLVADAIRAINEAGRPVSSLDLPSGLLADGGPVPEPTVRADLTVTFGLAKPGLYLLPGALHAGRVEVADLGVPREWLARGLRLGLVEAEDVRAALPPRSIDAHKGRHGHLLVVAGSIGKTGAAVLACRGALRAGTGLVTCAVPVSQQPVVAAQLAEAMTEPIPETAAQTLSAKALDRVLELAARMDAVAVGPGVGLEPETQGRRAGSGPDGRAADGRGRGRPDGAGRAPRPGARGEGTPAPDAASGRGRAAPRHDGGRGPGRPPREHAGARRGDRRGRRAQGRAHRGGGAQRGDDAEPDRESGARDGRHRGRPDGDRGRLPGPGSGGAPRAPGGGVPPRARG